MKTISVDYEEKKNFGVASVNALTLADFTPTLHEFLQEKSGRDFSKVSLQGLRNIIPAKSSLGNRYPFFSCLSPPCFRRKEFSYLIRKRQCIFFYKNSFT